MNETAEQIKPQPDDSKLRQFLGYRMKRAWMLIQADLSQALKPFDLRIVTFSILQIVVSSPGLRPSQLAETLDIERPNLVALLDELLRRDLLRKERDSHDRRAVLLHPTDAGIALCAKAHAAVSDREKHFFNGLSDDAVAQASKALTTVVRNITEPQK